MEKGPFRFYEIRGQRSSLSLRINSIQNQFLSLTNKGFLGYKLVERSQSSNDGHIYRELTNRTIITRFRLTSHACLNYSTIEAKEGSEEKPFLEQSDKEREVCAV